MITTCLRFNASMRIMLLIMCYYNNYLFDAYKSTCDTLQLHFSGVDLR